MLRTAILPVLLGLVPGASCGPAPVPLESAPAGTTPSAPGATTQQAPPLPVGTTEIPPGHPPIDGMPAGHPPLEGLPVASSGGEDVRFGGVVRLAGALATAAEGYVFVSVKPQGISMPAYSARYALADAGPLENGERRLAFELDQEDQMGGLVPGALVVEALFDPDGMVESKEGHVRASVDTEVGSMTAEIVLGS